MIKQIIEELSYNCKKDMRQKIEKVQAPATDGGGAAESTTRHILIKFLN